MKLWFKFANSFPRTATFFTGLAILSIILIILSAFLFSIIMLGMLITGIFQIHIESTFLSFLLIGLVGTGFLVVLADIVATVWNYGKTFMRIFYDKP